MPATVGTEFYFECDSVGSGSSHTMSRGMSASVLDVGMSFESWKGNLGVR